MLEGNYNSPVKRICIAALAFGAAASSFGQVYFAGTGHYYEAVKVPSGITWSDANAAAIASGGYLASILSSDENDFVFSLVNDPSFFTGISVNGDRLGPWLGGINTGSGWGWTNGDTFSYSNWHSGQPDGYGGGNQYIQFYDGANVGKTWGDHPGGNINGFELPKGYVVEFNAVPEPTSLAALGVGALALLRRRRPRVG